MDVPGQIIVFGLSHHVAPIEVRERVALTEAELPAVLHQLHRQPHLHEVAILTTCNRTEIYAVASEVHLQRHQLFEFLRTVRPEVRSEEETLFYFHEGQAAVEHLFKVAAGMDSMVVGEPQILGQVKDAFAIAQEAGTTGTLLNKLFLFAIAAGKRVRSETALGKGAISVASAAVELTQKIFRDLSQRAALIIGAGETGTLVAQHLKEKHIGQLFITNRTHERAVQLAQHLGIQVIPWEEIATSIERMDIIVGTTSAPQPILTREAHGRQLGQHAGIPRLLIDIAVPRDFDEALNTLPNVILQDIDDLQAIVEHNLQRRRQELPAAMRIVQEEAQKFMAWRNSLQVKPTIVALQARLQALREAELERFRHRVSEEEFAHLERITQNLINKILHLPLVKLREYSNNGGGQNLMRIDVIKEIFGLEDKQDES